MREYLRLADAEEGMEVELDGAFTCVGPGVVRLHKDVTGLYFPCDCGRHYIDDQAVFGGVRCVGMYPIDGEKEDKHDKPGVVREGGG